MASDNIYSIVEQTENKGRNVEKNERLLLTRLVEDWLIVTLRAPDQFFFRNDGSEKRKVERGKKDKKKRLRLANSLEAWFLVSH